MTHEYEWEESGIDGSRLQSGRSGATKPVKPNDTADGRQANRCVELVKI